MRQIASVDFKKTFIFSCLFKEDFLRVHHLCFLNQSLAQNSYKENSVSSCVPALLMNFWFNRTLRNGFGTDPRKSMQFQSASAN